MSDLTPPAGALWGRNQGLGCMYQVWVPEQGWVDAGRDPVAAAQFSAEVCAGAEGGARDE